jgi:hypothetical protein
MKCKVQAGLALAGGYLLGRTKKLKFALMLGGLAAGRGLSTNPTALLKQGTDAVRSNAELTKLVEQARGGLMDAGKAAVIAAASNRMESMSERLSDRASSVSSAVPDRVRGRGDGADGEEYTDEANDDQGPAEADDVEREAETDDDQSPAEAGNDEDKDEDEARGDNGPSNRGRSRGAPRERDGSSAPRRSTSRRRSAERPRARVRRGEDDG